MANQGMLTESLADVLEEERWIPDYFANLNIHSNRAYLPNLNPEKGREGMIELIQEPQISIDEAPQFMNWYDLSEEEKASGRYKVPDEELARLSEIVAAGKAYWDAVLQGAIEFLGGGGMLKSDEQNKQSDDKLIALAQQQADINKAQADANLALANTQTSKNVAKDLEGEGRRKSVKIENLRGEKPGWEMAEGTNWWSVNEKDPYWQTKEGHKEAMNLYGTKPSYVKEPSLEYNPRTGKYDPIEKEEFAEIKPKKRISL